MRLLRKAAAAAIIATWYGALIEAMKQDGRLARAPVAGGLFLTAIGAVGWACRELGDDAGAPGPAEQVCHR